MLRLVSPSASVNDIRHVNFRFLKRYLQDSEAMSSVRDDLLFWGWVFFCLFLTPSLSALLATLPCSIKPFVLTIYLTCVQFLSSRFIATRRERGRPPSQETSFRRLTVGDQPASLWSGLNTTQALIRRRWPREICARQRRKFIYIYIYKLPSFIYIYIYINEHAFFILILSW